MLLKTSLTQFSAQLCSALPYLHAYYIHDLMEEDEEEEEDRGWRGPEKPASGPCEREGLQSIDWIRRPLLHLL